MNPICFYTVFDDNFKTVGTGLVNSIKHFYPDIPVEVCTPPQPWSLESFCNYHCQRGYELLDEYERIIFIDSDSVMTGRCDDLFDPYDLGVVQNNISVGDPYGGISGNVYINNGLTVCTLKDAWKEYLDKYRSYERWEPLNEQNALNYVAHTTKHLCKLLEFPDRSYGIFEMDRYHLMYLKDGELYVPASNQEGSQPKKVKILHFAGRGMKEQDGSGQGRLMFEQIENDEARNYIINLCGNLT